MLKNLNFNLKRKIKIKYLNKNSNQQVNKSFNLKIILSKNNIEDYLYDNLKKFDSIK